MSPFPAAPAKPPGRTAGRPGERLERVQSVAVSIERVAAKENPEPQPRVPDRAVQAVPPRGQPKTPCQDGALLPRSPQMRASVSVENLTIRRGERVLVRDLSFTVPPGELLLLRGPNGAGKTSLLLCLAGILGPAAGAVAAGEPDHMHLLGHLSAVKPRLTVRENLMFWCALLRGDPALVAPSLETVALARAADLEAGHLSAGQTRRLAIARLLVADRPLWLLDEPAAALDAEGELLVARLLDAHLGRGGLAVAAVHHDLHLPPPANVRTLTLGTP